MATLLKMPKLSPTMESGVIVKWNKKEGEQIKAGEILIEVATDKATVEHEALDDGWLRRILVKEGDEAQVNQPIAIVTTEQNESIEGVQIAAPVQPAAEKPEESQGTPPEEQNTAAPKAALGMVQPSFAPEPPLTDYTFALPREGACGRVMASPLARKLAEERKLDLTSVQGTGPGGRIMSQDLDKAQQSAGASFASGRAPQIVPGTYEDEKLSPMRKAIAQRLQAAKTFIPHYYVRRSIHVDALVATREQLEVAGIKVSLNDFIIRACALALRKHPKINSGYNSVNQTITRYKTIDICVAVSVEDGLITPVIWHADHKNLGEISSEVRHLAKKAREGKLQPQDYRGGSFTLSNLGMYGVDEFTAVINPPQAAILAVGAVMDQAIIKNGKPAAGKILNLVLSSDHRVIDGAIAAQFLQTVKLYLENPAVLIV